MKKINKILALCITIVLVLSSIVFVNAEEKMKGVWVSTVSNLDYPKTKTTDAESLKAEAVEILDNCKSLGLNAVFFQVRPASDAFYKSEIYPWSQWLTGSQGTAPDNGFDPLEFWINEAHKRGIELHAWINPYRITNNGISLTSLAHNNPARINPEYAVKYTNGNYYYDPAIPQVRQMVIDGVMEIVNNYNVDGIHMDDYFYPGSEFDDHKSFEAYNRGFTDKEEWRRDNVNLLVKGISDAVRGSGKNVKFGISPSGIWANKDWNELGSATKGFQSYYSIYADTRKWAVENWIDYIAPQLYWEIGYDKADYSVLVNWWADILKNSNTRLYIGMGDYRCDSADATSGWYNGKAIKAQLDLNNTVAKVSGEIHFRYSSIIKNSSLYNIIQNVCLGRTEPATEPTTGVINEETVAATKPDVIQEPTVSSIQTDEIKVLINGTELKFDQPPIIENGRTLVPMRAIFEALGAQVSWDSDNNKVTAKNNDTVIAMVIGKNNMTLNSKTVSLDVAPKLVNGRTLVPIRAVSEAFDAQVGWSNSTRTVTIKK